LQALLSDDHDAEEASRFHAGRGGHLKPVMCVDKALDELDSFAGLVAESEDMGRAWDIVLLACLSGRNGINPDSAAVDEALKIMLHTVESGGDLSKYMALDRNGVPLQFA